VGSQQNTVPVIRPVRDEDVEVLPQLTLAALEPAFPPLEQTPVLPPTAAWMNRLACHGQTTTDLEQTARGFVLFAEEQTKRALAGKK